MESSRDMVIRDDPDRFQWVMLLGAKTRKGLTKAVRERNWRNETGSGADCTSQIYMAECKLLQAFKQQDKTWVGIVLCAEYRDV